MSIHRDKTAGLDQFEVVPHPTAAVHVSSVPPDFASHVPPTWVVWTLAEINARVAAHAEHHRRREENARGRVRAVFMFATIAIAGVSMLGTCCIAARTIGLFPEPFHNPAAAAALQASAPESPQRVLPPVPNAQRRAIVAVRGDTVCGLAKRYRLDPNAIIDANHLEVRGRNGLVVANLREGHRLLLPSPKARGRDHVRCF